MQIDNIYSLISPPFKILPTLWGVTEMQWETPFTAAALRMGVWQYSQQIQWILCLNWWEGSSCWNFVVYMFISYIGLVLHLWNKKIYCWLLSLPHWFAHQACFMQEPLTRSLILKTTFPSQKPRALGVVQFFPQETHGKSQSSITRK